MSQLEEFIENIRQEIRKKGYIKATKLAVIIVKRSHEWGLSIDAMEILKKLPCDEIKTIEYTNWDISYRLKDLYYYLPRSSETRLHFLKTE